MTENSLVMDRVTDDPPTDDKAAAKKRQTMLLGGVLAVAILAAGSYFFFLSGSGSGSSTEAINPVTATRRTAVKPTKHTKSAPVKKPAKVQVPATSTERLGKDPFLALYVQPAASTVTAGTSTSGTTSPAASAATTTTTPATTTAAPTAKTYPIRLSRVYGSGKDRTGVFGVNGKTQLAKVGSTFGPTQELKLLSLQQSRKGVWTAVVQVGDGQPVDAALGRTLYVR